MQRRSFLKAGLLGGLALVAGGAYCLINTSPYFTAVASGTEICGPPCTGNCARRSASVSRWTRRVAPCWRP